MLRHYSYRKKLSALIDGELNVDETRVLEAHLEACSTCRAELVKIREGKELTSYFEKPYWQASERLWTRLQEETNSNVDSRLVSSERKSDWLPILRPRLPWLGVAAALIALFLVARSLMHLQDDRQPDGNEWPIQTASTLTIDFGLYLDALKSGKEPVEFERRYGSQVTTYEMAKSQAHFRLPPLPKMPKAFRLSQVQTLKSACCFSVQMSCLSDSERIIIFQQPKDHPVTFGSYELSKTQMNGRNCYRIEVGGWRALCWSDDDTQYVVMSRLGDTELAQALRELM